MFITILRKTSNEILKQQSDFVFHLKRNLENEISHNSPDWSVYAKFSSIALFLDQQQYKLIRGILDNNIGEKPTDLEKNMGSNFIVSNPNIETVLSGQIWNVIRICFELENVNIELAVAENSLAQMSIIRSTLIYESFSDESKLVDLVSKEIRILDCRAQSQSRWRQVLFKKHSESQLQLEVHYRSNKTSNRFSIVFNNCKCICLIDWIIQMKRFISSYKNPSENISQAVENLNEFKFNLTNTDFLLTNNFEISNAHAVILRLTAFLEYNERRPERLIETRLQSAEVFSCKTDSIEDTEMTIIDPFILSMQISKNSSALVEKSKSELAAQINADIIRMRLSYLDIKFLSKVFDYTKTKFLGKHFLKIYSEIKKRKSTTMRYFHQS